jgi:hypothetical protein
MLRRSALSPDRLHRAFSEKELQRIVVCSDEGSRIQSEHFYIHLYEAEADEHF